MKATRSDVAKLAGVSTGTVSYYLNGTRKLTEKTSKKIDDAIKQLDYVPNMVARSMVKKESKMLTIIANEFNNPMYGEIIFEFEKAAMEKGYSTTICSGYFELHNYINMIIARKIDGVYICANPLKIEAENIKKLLNNNIKIISGNYLLDNFKDIGRVDLDYDTGIRDILTYLKSKGHEKIVYLNGMVADYPMDQREHSFKKYMREFYNTEGRVLNGNDINNMHEDLGQRLCAECLEKYPDTTAMFFMSDTLALGGLEELRRRNIQVPQQISVISMEDNTLGKYTYPKLTTMGFDKKQFSTCVVNQLINMIHNKPVKETLIPMHLIVRESVGPVQSSLH